MLYGGVWFRDFGITGLGVCLLVFVLFWLLRRTWEVKGPTRRNIAIE